LEQQETHDIPFDFGDAPFIKLPHPTREEPIELFADPTLGPTCFILCGQAGLTLALWLVFFLNTFFNGG
jgi:hypothetical protein